MLQALQDLSPFEAIRTSAYWFPAIETVHVAGLVMVIGTVAMVDLRLAGVSDRGQRISTVTAGLLPWTWMAFIVTVATGLLLFGSNAVQYASNKPFLIKMGLLALAGLNMAAFHAVTQRGQSGWDDAASPPAPVKLAGALSLALWIGIIFAGRWIGFVL